MRQQRAEFSMLRIVVNINVWIRILLRGRTTLPILSAWQADRFQLITSQALLVSSWQILQQTYEVDDSPPVTGHYLTRSSQVSLGEDTTG